MRNKRKRVRVKDKPLIYVQNSFTNFLFNHKAPEKIKEKYSLVEEINKDLTPYKRTIFKEFFEDLYFFYPPKELEEKDYWGEVLGKPLHEEISKLPEFKKLRNMTKGDILLSMGATISISDTILEVIKKILKEIKKEKKNQNCNKDLPVNIAQDITRKVLKGETKRIKGALMETYKKAKAQKDITGFLWGTEKGGINKIENIEERLKILVELYNSSRFRKITDLIGKLQHLVTSLEMVEAGQGAGEIVDIELGDDIARTLPTQLVRLRDKRLKLLFYKDWVEKKLMQYSLEGVERKSRGEIVICIDKSGSMRGDKIDMAIAVAGAVARICEEQNRPCHCIFFSRGIDKEVLNIHKDRNKFIDLLSIDASGGTDFTKPLKRSLELVTDKGDILFVTDGYADKPPQEYIEEKKKKKTRLFFIAIDVYLDSLKDIADMIVNYRPGSDIKELGRIIKKMTKEVEP